ncbi:MAG: response regulator [Oscillatoria sp. SIO1A7]|nr:response regulator [Oscillatoria sp. SIO1A7]
MNNPDLEDLLDASPSGSNHNAENSDDWLTSLADLFEGEVPELDTTWSEEEIIDYSQGNGANEAGSLPKKDKETELEPEEDDFADLLLFEPRESSRNQTYSSKADDWLEEVESYNGDDGDNFFWDEEIDEGSALNTQSNNSPEQTGNLLELSAPTDSSGQILSEIDFEDMFALGEEKEPVQKQPAASSESHPSQLEDLTNLFDEVPSEFLAEPEKPAESGSQSVAARHLDEYDSSSSDRLEFDEGEELLDDVSFELGEPEEAIASSFDLEEESSDEIDSGFSFDIAESEEAGAIAASFSLEEESLDEIDSGFSFDIEEQSSDAIAASFSLEEESLDEIDSGFSFELEEQSSDAIAASFSLEEESLDEIDSGFSFELEEQSSDAIAASFSLEEESLDEIDSEFSDLLAINSASPPETPATKNLGIELGIETEEFEELDSSAPSLDAGFDTWDWELETAQDETKIPEPNNIESSEEDFDSLFDDQEELNFSEGDLEEESIENNLFEEEAALDSEDDFASLFDEEAEQENLDDLGERTAEENELAIGEPEEEAFWLNFDEAEDEEEAEDKTKPNLLAGLDSLFEDTPSEPDEESVPILEVSESVINELQQEVKQPNLEWSYDEGSAAIDDWDLSGEAEADNFEESWFIPEGSSSEEEPGQEETVGDSEEEIYFSEDEEYPDLSSGIEAESADVSEEAFEELDEEGEFIEESAGVVFVELDALLGSSKQKRQADRLEEINFAPLEALLDEPAQINGVDFTTLEALLGQPTTIDFAALEAVLDEEPQTAGEIGQNAGTAMEATKGAGADEEESQSNGDEGAAPGRSTMPATGAPFMEQTMKVPVRQLDNLNNLVGELVVNRNSLEQDQERMRQFLDNLLHQVQNLADVGQRMQDLYERVLLEMALLSSRQGSHFLSANSGHDQMSVFDMDRFTPFHTLAQEILELIVRVRESSSDIEFLVDETEQVTRQLRQITTQLQEGLTRSRMVPFSDIADRLRRGVRDNAINFGKQVELTLEGRETLVDKMILEKLHDPLNHLVNNALAHGVELPQVREGKGKDPRGTIVVRAFHQGNQTVIAVSDDGAGIDAQKVKVKAIEKGVITPAEAKTMSRLDVYDLLFEAGFSTRDKADQLAGRGVGMDVVRRRVSEIRGVVNVDSTLGKGTTFTIRLPLALSISKALVCISDRVRIAFPMDGVEDMLDVPRDKVQIDSSSSEENQQFIPWRDTMLPFRSLRDLLRYNRHLGRGSMYGGNTDEEIISVVVLRSAGNYLALQVDQVLGEQEIVIKQLEGPVAKPMGIAGATVMGDGRIVAIADVLEMIDIAAGRIRRDVPALDTSTVEIESVVQEQPTVLIVDDSITVRELLSMTFNKAGYRVEQARDGQEAWEKLRSGLPCDIVFCDIEMPRMDGLQLLSQMQKDPHLHDLPIAMLTSRGADKHRQMAVQMGASGYFTKPYLEEALLEAASRMLKGENLVLA